LRSPRGYAVAGKPPEPSVAGEQSLPLEGTVLITVAERDRQLVLDAAREFAALGFKIRATAGTHAFLDKHGIATEPILKLHEGRPNIEDAIKNGEIQLVVNTAAGLRATSCAPCRVITWL
jgi:carbamoyl-phosphate synthase large subunit